MSRALFQHWEFQSVISIRGILIVAIFDKMQRLKASDLEGAAAVTLMSTDVDGTEMFFTLVYEFVSCLFVLGMSIWFLYRMVGNAVFLIFIPTMGKFKQRAAAHSIKANFNLPATFIGSFWTAKVIGKRRAATNAETQRRITATSNVLAQIKSVKSMGLSESISAYVRQKRDYEISVAMKERYAMLWVFGSGKCHPDSVARQRRFASSSPCRGSNVC